MGTHTCPWWLAYSFDNPARRLVHDPAAILDGLVEEGQTVVDVGCGLGTFSLAMAGKVGPDGRVIGLDIQQEMVSRARARAERQGLDDRIEFRVCRPDSLELHETVDFVLAFWMVHEVADPQAFLAEVRAALSPAGRLLIVEPRVHVPERRFEKTLALARASGFDVEPGPRVWFSRAAVCSPRNRAWTAVDAWITEQFVRPDPPLERTLERSREAGLPDIQVSESQGRFLTVLGKALGARRILELGTLGGYSTLCLARALPPDGVLISLEIDASRARLARQNLVDAGLAGVAQIVEGPAQDTLAVMIEQGTPPFDLVFIDADKPGYPAYLDLVLELSREGTLILADNVVRKGDVLDPDSTDPNARGAREFNQRLASDPRVEATVLQTVGSKGHDGFAFAVVVDPAPGRKIVE